MTDSVGSGAQSGAVSRTTGCGAPDFGPDLRHHVADIYEQYASHIAAYAIRRTSHTDAADVVAETFLVAWRRREVVPQEPNTLPWLCGVARRVLANQRRSHRRRGRLSERLTAEFSQHDVCTPPFENAEEFRRVARAIDKLSEDDAELLRLLAWEALTPSEIAIAMEIAPGTARQRISRARQRLQKQLASDGYDLDLNINPGINPDMDTGTTTAADAAKRPAAIMHRNQKSSRKSTVLYPKTGGGVAQ